MKIHLLSDLHLEFAEFTPDPTAVRESDVIVLAGDIHKGIRGIQWARDVFGSKRVIYVCGNHEFYGEHWDQLLAELRGEATRVGVHFLEDEVIDIEGIRFLGSSLWTDFKFFRDRPMTGVMRACEKGMNDFHVIRAGPLNSHTSAPHRPSSVAVRHGKRLTARHVIARHEASLKWLQQELNAANAKSRRPVVITHHLPSAASVAPKYARDDLTASFASHLDYLIPQTQLWMHGHTHDSYDYSIDIAGLRSRVICNPRGYPLSRAAMDFENTAFDRGLIVEV